MKNILKRYILIAIGIVIHVSTAIPQIVFQSTVHDFNILSNWSQTPAIFEFENKGEKQEAFINAVRATHVHVKYPARFIEPGEKGQLLIWFEPQTIGRFNEKVKVYISSSADPVEFTIRGTINSWMECPGVNQPEDKSRLISEHRGLVINALTKETVSLASIRFTDTKGKSKTIKTNKQGHFRTDLMLGMYHILVTAAGYHNLDDMMYLNANTPELVFEIMPLDPLMTNDKKPAEEPKPDERIKSSDETFVVEGLVLDDSTGTTINKASVTLLETGSRLSYFYKTLPDGKFSRRIKPGKYLISCAASDYLNYTDTLILAEATTQLNIRMRPDPDKIIIPEYYVKGMVLDIVSLFPIVNAELIFINQNNLATTTNTNRNAEFSITLRPGMYEVRIKAENYEETRMRDFTVDKEKTDIFFYLTSLDEKRMVDQENKDPIVVFIDDEVTPLPTQDTISGIVILEPVPEVKPEEYLSREKYASNNIVFLIDISSSMKFGGKLDHLKTAMIRLTEILRDIDRLSLITFAATQRIHFISITSDHKDTIIRSIENLQAFGMTYGVKGLGIAFEITKENYIPDGNNQVIIATDGDFNSPEYTEFELRRLIRSYANQGIILSVVGFGNEPAHIRRMQKMARLGNGKFILVNNEQQAKIVLIEEIKEKSDKIKLQNQIK